MENYIENMIPDKLPGKLEKPKIKLPIDKSVFDKVPDKIESDESAIENGSSGEAGPQGEPGPQGEQGPTGPQGEPGQTVEKTVFRDYVWKWPTISFNPTPKNKVVYRDTKIINNDESTNPLIYLIIGIGITILIVLMLRR